jgi:hypothetical protein
MSAALVELVSVGAQDAYIKGDPQVSFFRQNFKRHTNFALKPERLDYIGSFAGGNEVVIPIKSKGDLLSYIWIENPGIAIPGNSGDNTGLYHQDAAPTEFSLYIGGQEVVRLDSMFIQGVHNVLYQENQARASTSVSLGELKQSATTDNNNIAGHYRIPFFFSEDWTKALPLVAMQYHEVELRIKCRPGLDALTPKVYGMYAYLDSEEREHFTSTDHEILITQVQYQPASKTDTSIDLTYFNHPVKALHLVNGRGATQAWTNANNFKFDTASLYINGLALYENMTSVFHHTVVPENHCSVVPDDLLQTISLFTWPFCLTMNKSQPSGTLNFSRIDNAKLTMDGLQTHANNSDNHRVYAVNYNILRVKDGMAGVAFSN